MILLNPYRYGVSVAPIDPSVIFASYAGIQLDPSDLTKMWVETSGKTTAVAADGDLVGMMTDKGPAAYDFDSSTNALRPTYRTSGGIHWLESNLKVMRHTTANPTASKSQYTKMMAFEIVSIPSNGIIEVAHGAPFMQHSGGVLSFYSNSGVRRTINALSAPEFDNGVKVLLTQVFDGSLPATHADRNKLYVNGDLFATTGTAGTINATTSATAGVIVGALTAATTNAINIKWYQYLSFGGVALSDPDRLGVEQFCKNKMGV